MNKISPRITKFEMKLPLERFIPAAFMVFLLCVIVLSIISFRNIDEYKEDVKWISFSHEIIRKNSDINILIFQLTVYRKVYLSGGDMKYRSEYYGTRQKLIGEIDSLKSLTNVNPVQQRNVHNLDTLIKGRLTLLDSTVESFFKEKKNPANEADIMEKIRKDLLDISYYSKKIEDEENILLLSRNVKGQISNTNIQIYIIITSLAAFIIIGLSLYVSSKLIKNKNTAEKLLQKSYDELEDKVEERTAELQTSNENLLSEINNRIKIENSLRESEERFRVMADSAPVLIWMSGHDKGFSYVNKVWTDFTGRTLKETFANGWIEDLHPDDMVNCLNIYAHAFDNHVDFEIEFRLKASDGEYRWFLNKGIPRYDSNEFAGFIGICVDIHLKKRNESYLKIQYNVSKTLAEALNTEDALHELLENICTSVNWKFGIAWIIEDNKLVQKALWGENNSDVEAYLALFDKTFKLDLGEALPGRIWKDNKSHWIENISEDGNLPRKAGLLELGWQSVFGIPISDNGKVTAVIECFNQNKLTPKTYLLEVLESVGRQIGNFFGRKKAEENLKIAYDELELRVNERTIELANTLNKLLDEMATKEKVQNKLKLFGHAIRGIRECVFITDLQSKTIFVNPAFESVYGYFESEILGENIPVLNTKSISADKRKEIISAALKTGWKGELVNTKSDGSEFFINLSVSVIRDDEGKVDSIVGIVQDITEEKNTTALLEKRNRLLKLLNDVIIGTNKIENADKCISFAINKVCEYLHWEIGHFFLNKEGKLVSTGLWNEKSSPEFDIFRAFSEEIVLEKNEGFREHVFEDRKPSWININSLSGEDVDETAEICLKTGLKSAVWVPVISRGDLMGALEFFYKETAEPDMEVMDCLTNIAVELGSFTERSSFIEMIKEREKHFKAIADTANDAIVTANSEGKIIYVNKSVVEIFGYEIDELLNEDLTILMPEKYKEPYRSSFNSGLAAGENKLFGKTLELTARKKDGSEFPVELSLAKWDMNNEHYFTGMIRDISLRKQTQTELIESRNSLLEAQSITKMGNWEWDISSDTVKWSDEMYSIYELIPEEFTPSFEGFLSRLIPESYDEVKSKIETSFKTKSSFEFYERIITPSGRIKILRSQGGVKLDDNGSVIKMVGTCLDITKMREAEEKLRENEERLRLILDNVKDYAIIMIDENGFIKSWNKGAEQINGYKAEEIIGKHISVFYRQEDIEAKEAQNNLEFAAKYGCFEKEDWRVRKDGSLFLANIIFTPVYDNKNKITGFVKVTRNITERKQAEEALKQSENQLKEAQKIAKLGSWDWNIKTNKVTWSEEMHSIYGVDSKSFEGTIESYRDLIHPDDLELVRNTVENSIKNKEPFNYYHKIITPAGEVKILNAQGEIHLNPEGEIEGLFGVSMDVTEIKNAEEKIRKSEKQLKEAQQITKLGSWEADLRTGKILWSDEMFRIHGLEKKEFGPDYKELRELIYPDDLPLMDELAVTMIEKPQQKDIQYRITAPNGCLKYLKAELRVEYDEFAIPVRIFGSVQDITDIKLVEEELRRINSKLSETQKKLVHNEKLAALGRFSSGIAHEIRNPLANISALSQLLSKLDLDERSKKHLKYILINTDIANKIIKDLLNFASPEDLVFENEDINEIINNILESAAPRCLENKIKIIKDISSDKLELYIDKIRMENAIMNFISNSIEAMPEGGKLSVSVKMEKISEKVIIKISDTGEGIPQENIDKIFEPFYTSKKDGTGLGLALSFQTVKSHSGELDIESKLNEGTTIKISIPVNKKTE